jgi:hypothetical protein
MQIKDYYHSYQELGLTVIPIEWDIEKKGPVSHRLWSEAQGLKLLPKHNALMVKADGNYACLDFDVKNTNNKEIFDQWKTLVINQWPEVYNKCYVELTRSNGYHVWFQYPNLEKKLSLAGSEKGAEVIALYAKGPLIYTFPTPGYSEYSGSMEDAQELSEKEFNYLIETSQGFNEYQPKYDPTLKAVSYPVGHEYFLSEFDRLLPDEYWAKILNEIGLLQITNYRYNKKDNFTAYRRIDSDSDAISAKVYFHTKRVLIFSASLHSFPNWHNKHDYPVWSLPPSFVLFYKFNRDWQQAIEYIEQIADGIGLDISAPVQTEFPLHVYPDVIRRSIIEVAAARSIPIEFLAMSGLWTVSSLAGTHYDSEFNGDARNILFCLLIAPVSVGKTPAYKSMCETPLKILQEKHDHDFAIEIAEYEAKKEEQSKDKKKVIGKKPRRFIPFAVDGTTEGYVGLSMDQKNGLGVYHDEAETILNAGAFKTNNDAVSFFTQAFGGGRYTQIRADRDKERVVPNMNINLMMGTQPGRLVNIFTKDKLESGFASRFLMVESGYIPLNTEIDPFSKNKEMCPEWVDLLQSLYHSGLLYNAGDRQKIMVRLTDEAKDLYRKYNRSNLMEANERFTTKAEQYIIGTEAKMSTYFPRFVFLLSILHNNTEPIATPKIVQYAYELYKYFAKSTIKIIGSLSEEIDTGLPAPIEMLYQALPDTFTRKEATELCLKLNLSPNKFEISMRRKDFKALFRKADKGVYFKI